MPEPFWYDEAFSFLVARLSWPDLLTATAGDVHPPAYYVLLKLWLMFCGAKHGDVLPQLNSIEVSARLLSVVTSLVALWLYWRLLKKLQLPSNQAQWAWILACFLPALTYFAVEARMYALLEVFVLAAVLALWSGRPVIAGMMLAGAMYTQNVGIIYTVVILGVSLLWRPDLWPYCSLAGGIAIALYAPWLPSLMSQVHMTEAGYWTWPPSLGTVAYMLFCSLFYIMQGSHAGLSSAVMILVGACVTYGLLSVKRFVIWAVPMGMVAALFIGSHILGTGMLLHRVLVPCAFFIAIAWAGLLVRKDIGPVLGLLTLAALVYGNYTYFVNGRTGISYALWDDVGVKPGDVIYAGNSSVVPLLLYTPAMVAVPPIATDKMHAGLSRQTMQALDIPIADLYELEWDRAWLLLFDTPFTTDEERTYFNDLLVNASLVRDDLGDDMTYEGALWLLEKSQAAIR